MSAREILDLHKRRDALFPERLFGDPAWNMLLDLLANDGRKISVTSLCIASGVPATTALRHIGVLQDLGLIERRDDPFDRRRGYLSLTADGLARMEALFRHAAPFIADERDGVPIEHLTQHASDDHANGQGFNCIPHSEPDSAGEQRDHG